MGDWQGPQPPPPSAPTLELAHDMPLQPRGYAWKYRERLRHGHFPAAPVARPCVAAGRRSEPQRAQARDFVVLAGLGYFWPDCDAEAAMYAR